MKIRSLGALAALPATAVLFGTVTPPAMASGSPAAYVALGDSYSAGTGTRDKVDACYRSPLGYPKLVATASGWTLDYQACMRATTLDVAANQVGALGPSTRRVSVTGGGNDAGFTSVLATCALPSWLGDCTGKLDQAQAMISSTIPGRLDSLYTTIRQKAPGATAAVVGYPLLFNGTDCNLLTFFSAAEQARANALTSQLDELLAGKARAHGMRFVDPRAAFAGHAVCDADAWINGASLPVEESYHPNAAGQREYAREVAGALGGQAPQLVSAAAVHAPAAHRVTAQDYAHLVPGLATTAGLSRARAVGLDPALMVRLDRELRSGNVGRARAALAQLRSLDDRVAAAHRQR